MRTESFTLAGPRTADRTLTAPFSGRGWSAYLVLAALLIPVILPTGPSQVTLLDVVNLGAFVAFAAALTFRPVHVALPFGGAAVLVGIGSLLAVSNADSVKLAVLTLVQDLYLYAWFILLVAVMSRHGDLRAFRSAWVIGAAAVAVLCLAQLVLAGGFPGSLLSAEGYRPQGPFSNPNLCADYLVLSVFVALSLIGQSRGVVIASAIALLLVGVLTTKSNGSLLALVVGLTVAFGIWVLRAEGSPARRVGMLALVMASLVLAVWANAEWGFGPAVSAQVDRGSVLGRVDKSSVGRQAIWAQLTAKLRARPLGIGPGNSPLQTVEIGHRVRPRGSFRAKEAHSDYVAYAVERGPIAFVGLLAATILPIWLVLTTRGGPRRGGDEKRLASTRHRLAVLRAAFVGGLVATAVHSAVIEKLHFRHYWMFLALACAATAGARFRAPDDGAWQRLSPGENP